MTERRAPDSSESDVEGSWEDADLSDLLQELRILLPGTQTLTAFLIILPFSPGFALIDQTERWVYMATFLCSVTSLILFTAPAAQHRLERPLRDRVRFKETATRQIVIGLIPLSIALVLSTQLVINEVGGREAGIVAAVVVTGLVGLMWWLVPLYRRPHS